MNLGDRFIHGVITIEKMRSKRCGGIRWMIGDQMAQLVARMVVGKVSGQRSETKLTDSSLASVPLERNVYAGCFVVEFIDKKLLI